MLTQRDAIIRKGYSPSNRHRSLDIHSCRLSHRNILAQTSFLLPPGRIRHQFWYHAYRDWCLILLLSSAIARGLEDIWFEKNRLGGKRGTVTAGLSLRCPSIPVSEEPKRLKLGIGEWASFHKSCFADRTARILTKPQIWTCASPQPFFSYFLFPWTLYTVYDIIDYRHGVSSPAGIT